MRISPISLSAFSAAAFRSHGIDSVRNGTVVPVQPVPPVVDMLSTRSLLWQSGMRSGSTMRRMLMNSWLHGRPVPVVVAKLSDPVVVVPVRVAV